MSADEAMKIICGDRPEWAVALRGLRYREGFTQDALGKILDIDPSDISKMERGIQSIDKPTAKRLAKIFKINYKVFL